MVTTWAEGVQCTQGLILISCGELIYLCFFVKKHNFESKLYLLRKLEAEGVSSLKSQERKQEDDPADHDDAAETTEDRQDGAGEINSGSASVQSVCLYLLLCLLSSVCA